MTAAVTGKINPFPAEADLLTEVKTEEVGLALFEEFEVTEIMAVSDSELELPPAEVVLAEVAVLETEAIVLEALREVEELVDVVERVV